MKLFKKPWVFFLPIIPITIIILANRSCNSKKDAVHPVKQDIVESVYASAMVKAAGQYVVYTPVSGLLQANLVKEGDTVTEGQVIAQIENSNPGLNADNARLSLELAEKNMGNLDEMQAQIETSRKQVSLDSSNFARQQQLWNENIGTKSQLEGRQLAYEASKNALRALIVRYRQTRIQLMTAEDIAKNNLNISSKSSRDFSITSRINGRVYSLKYKPGELVLPQQPVALIGRAGQFMIELSVDEVDISRISLGQQVLITMDAYGGQTFEAVISRILPNMDPKSQSFTLEAEFKTRPATLYPGLSAEANIVILKKSKALVIPIEYLKNGNTVVTKKGDVKVQTGLKSIDKIEILNGIDENTELLKPQ